MGFAKVLRLGFVGLGSVFEPYAAMTRALRGEGRIRVGRVSDVDSSRAGRASHYLMEDVPFSADPKAVIEDPAIDAVIILTSMAEHGSLALDALRAGKHVLVEKPMSTDLVEARQLVELSRPEGPVLVCAPHVVLSPTFQAIWKRVVHEQELGRIFLARARYGWWGPTWGRWFYQTGGGPLFDLGVYSITTLTGILGPVRQVTAFAGIARDSRIVDGIETATETPDNYQILLDFGRSTYASVTTGFTMRTYRSPAVELYGENGVVQMLGDDWAPNGYELSLGEHGVWQIHSETEPNWHWTSGLRHLVDVVGGARQLIAPAHAFHVLDVMIKAGEAAKVGVTQVVSSTFEPVPLDARSIVLDETERPHDHRIKREPTRQAPEPRP